MKILAVDTDKIALTALFAQLCKEYPTDEIKAFCDPMLAVQYGFQNRVDMIYTNIALKVMDGNKLATLIQGRQPDKVAVHLIQNNKTPISRLEREEITLK